MKQGHMALLFVIMYISCFLMLLWEQKKYDNTQLEKQKVETALLNAIEITGQGYEVVIYETDEIKKQFFEQNFFEALYLFFDVFADEEKQAYLMMHIPMLVLVEEDGAFFYYMVEEQRKDNASLLYGWSDKIEFNYSANCTETQKKTIVAQTLEKTASEIISKHNYIASQYGISYRFSVPDFLGNTADSLEFPMLFVVFQGWPLSAAGEVTYENCMDAAVFLQKAEPDLPVIDGIPYKAED